MIITKYIDSTNSLCASLRQKENQMFVFCKKCDTVDVISVVIFRPVDAYFCCCFGPSLFPYTNYLSARPEAEENCHFGQV